MSKEMNIFFDHVKTHFHFLVRDFGFHLSREQKTSDCELVEYCSSDVYVRVLVTGPDYLYLGELDWKEFRHAIVLIGSI